jgi:holliday junction DNA helicase RuvA
MIAKLKGIVDSLGEDWAVIDVAGVGYLVYGSAKTLARLAAGRPATLLVETHVREDHIHLYGFLEADEREWFRRLTTVQGVGVKVALAILSVLSPVDLVRAIAAADKASLTRAPGVGPKLAQRLIGELKDKVATIGLGAPAFGVVAGGDGGPGEDAISALVNLGYRRAEAYGVVAEALRRQGAQASVESLIRAGLKELAT